MIVKKENSTRLFWILQIVGWFTVDATNFIIDNGFSIRYTVYSYVAYSLIGILLSSAFRWYLKYRVKIDWYGKRDVFHLLIAVCVCIFCFFWAAYFLEYTYDRLWERTEVEIQYMEKNIGFVSNLIGSAMVIIGWTSIYYVVKIYMQREAYKAEQIELRAILQEAQLNTLKGQVNPHFMFNSLNNIRGLMLEDVEKSSEMITKLSEMLEYSLDKNTVDAIPISEELEMVENYIALSKIQMEDRLHYVEEVDNKSLDIVIPPMIIQLLVENAAKHGIANLKAGGTISLIIKKEAAALFIRVSNTGKLRISKDSTQLGLKNIKQRLRLLYGKKASFSLDEVENEVVAEIKIPIV